MTHTLQVSEVAAILGVSTERVRQLDKILRPIRVGTSKIRLYDPDIVSAVRRHRSPAGDQMRRALRKNVRALKVRYGWSDWTACVTDDDAFRMGVKFPCGCWSFFGLPYMSTDLNDMIALLDGIHAARHQHEDASTDGIA